MKSMLITFLAVFTVFLSSESNSYGKKSPNNKKYVFDIKAQPTTKEWKYFLSSNKKFKKDLWLYYEKQGVKLENWSWAWRLGWLKACQDSNTKWCTKILIQGLFDKAAVVRGEAATKIGKKYANTKNKQIINILKKSYSNPKNIRNKKPLFTQQRILFAIKQVGGKYAQKTAGALAQNHKKNTIYWNKLKKW